MRITQVSVEGCGRFGKLARIEGLGPGVNILSAGNEAGKSTLFRAIRTCLFERHSSIKEEIAALATEGLSLPVTITVAFEKEGKAYEIRKSFLRSKSASFSCDGVETARNAEADEEVWKLLGVEHKSTRALDEAAYGILWVAQGQSFHTPEPTEAARSAFNAVIQQEVGTLVGGERARLLLNGVNEELGKFLTKSGQAKANGPLDLAEKSSKDLTDQRIEAEAQLDALRARLDQLDQLRREMKAAADPAALRSLQEQLAEAQRQLAEAERAATELKRLETEERQAHQWAEAQQEKLSTLMERSTAIDGHRQRLKSLALELAPFDAQQDQASAALRHAAEAKSAIERELETLDAREAELQRLEALAAKLERRGEMERRLGLLEKLRSRAAASDAALKAATVDDAALNALLAIEREESRIRAALEAGAARLTIAARPGAPVTLNGAPAGEQTSRPVTEPLTIAVGADVSIIVAPPAAAGEAAASALAKEREKLSALLVHHGLASPAELRQRHAERLVLEDAARELRAERAALGIKDTVAAEIDRLSAAIAEIAAEATRVLHEGKLPSAGEMTAERQSLATRRAALRTQRAAHEAEAAAHRDTLTKLAGRRGTLRGQAEAIDAQITSALALLPDETRATVIAACEAELAMRRDAHRIKAAALEQERARAPAADAAERQKIRVERLQSAIDAQSKKVATLREAIASLEGEVKATGGEGLGERAATLEVQQQMAIAEASRLREHVEVLKLLRDKVQACHDRRREELNRPLLRHLTPFLGDVFPEAKLSLGENFSIEGLSRTGPAAELFGRLSLGTQEQVAVLVRLAMGAMICERGTPVPVILDDALVFSDDARIEQMFDAINRAGRNQQVIVLTCRARSFASLGGRQLQIV